MPKIYCADVACRYNNDENACTAPKVELSWNSIMTVWEGRREFNTCRTREPATMDELIRKVAKAEEESDT